MDFEKTPVAFITLTPLIENLFLVRVSSATTPLDLPFSLIKDSTDM